jgi:hypothetical protein
VVNASREAEEAWPAEKYRHAFAGGIFRAILYTNEARQGTFIVGRKLMARIIVEPAPNGYDLSDRFVKALKLLRENGIKPQSRTKLVSKYAVIVVEDPVKVVEHLRAENIPASVER